MTATTSTLPVDAVKALEAARVAGWLGLEPSGRERHKFPCVWCESGDALDLKPGKLPKCFSCGKSGSVVDLAMQKLGLDFVEAVKWLADRAGILIPQTGYEAARTRRPTETSRPAEVSPSKASPAAPERDPVAVSVFTAAIEHLRLTGRSVAYLADRGLGFPQTCCEVGFRSLDGKDDLRALYRALRLAFPEDILRPLIRPGTWLPFGETTPVLLIAYQRDGEVETFRFRNLAPNCDKKFRYRDLKGHAPQLPWHADDLSDLAGHDLHVVEGELNALSLWGEASTLRVVALPGAGRSPGGSDAAWLREAGQAKRILCWFDADQAGDAGAVGFATRLMEANGWSAAEARERVKRVRPDVSGDLNEILQRGALSALVAELVGSP